VSATTLEIRPLGRDDVGAIHEVLAQSLATPRALIEVTLEAQPDGFLGAEADGALVGVVSAVRYPAFAFIGLMGVRASHQGRGIGRRLFTRLLDDLDEAGRPLARLEATDAGYPLYASVGFTDEFETAVYRRDPAAPAPDPRGPVEPVSAANLEEVLALDHAAFGTDRARVLAAALARWPERAILARDARGRVAGWLLAQPDRLGPWVVADASAAQRLLAAALALPFAVPPSAGVPAASTAAARALEGAGFARVRRTRRMRRGPGEIGGQPGLVWGHATLGLG
jgi:ribosomal protein S18 acetylase RimI-like enzyme